MSGFAVVLLAFVILFYAPAIVAIVDLCVFTHRFVVAYRSVTVPVPSRVALFDGGPYRSVAVSEQVRKVGRLDRLRAAWRAAWREGQL